MNNFDPPLLLVERRDGESVEELLACLQAQYSARPDDQPGPAYTLGPTYLYHGQRFSSVLSCAGALFLRRVFEQCARSVIARFDSDLPLKLLSPGGLTNQIDESELSKEETSALDC